MNWRVQIHSYIESDGQGGTPAEYDDDEEEEEEHDRELEEEDEEGDVYEDEEGAVKVKGIEGNDARGVRRGHWKWVKVIMIMAMVLKEWCSGGGNGGREEGE